MNGTARAGYKQTEVGVIPLEWDVANLSDVSSKITDGEHVTPIRTKQGYFLLSARNVLDGRIDVSDVDYVGVAEYVRIKQRCNPESGDILISCSGTIGRVSVVPENFKCVLVRSAALAKLDRCKVDSNFIQYWLQAGNAQGQIFRSVNQGAQPNLFLNHIERLQCPKPPLPEQRAIASALSDVDALLALVDTLIAKKRDLKVATMQQLLTGQTRLPGFSVEWEVKRLGDVAHVKTGAKNNDDKVEDGEYPLFVRSQTVERIDSYSYDCEAILVPGEGGIGSIFHYINGKFDCHQRVYKISAFNVDTCGKFVFFCMKHFFHIQASRNSVKATVDSLRLPTFLEFEFLAPALKEQQAIVDALDDMDAELTALEARRDKTRALKQGMMQELLTGRIRLL